LGLLALLLAETGALPQISNQVFVGEVYALGVEPVPGESYEWHIYTDHTLLIETDSSFLILLNCNTGPVIPIIWMKTGLYYFTISAFTLQGCMNLKVGLILISPTKSTPAIQILVDHNPVCPNTPVIFRAITFNTGLLAHYQWFRNGIPTGENSSTYTDATLMNDDIIYCHLTSNTYLSVPNTAVSNEITMKVVSPTAAFTIADHQDGLKGACRMMNHSTGADNYFWDFGNGLSSLEENPTVTYIEDGTYRIWLTAINQLGCSDTAWLDYSVLFTGLYIPNAFAPDIVGVSGSLFKPMGINLKEFSIQIYDNWGDLLWESRSLDELGRPAEAWDGTFRGAPLPQGTYMWKVHAVFKDNTIWTGSDIGKGRGKTIGTVTLIR